jgi:hypothetical protein
MSVVAACSDDDDGLSIDEAAVVDDGATAAAGLFGTADISFDGVTSSVSGVTCSTDDGVTVSPIITDTFTLTIAGGTAGTWDVRVTQPGNPELVWTAVEPTVEVDGDVLAGSAQVARADDPTITAALAFVVDC